MKRIARHSWTALAVGLSGLVGQTPAQERSPAGAEATDAPAAVGDAGAPGPCPPAGKVCVPVPGGKQIPRTVYGCKDVWYCLPRLPSLWDLFHGWHTCDPVCGPPQCK